MNKHINVNDNNEGQSRSTAGLGCRGKVGKWLNELPDKPANKADIARLCAAYDRLCVGYDRQEVEIARLRNMFRVNMLRLAPETSHIEIDRVLDGEPSH